MTSLDIVYVMDKSYSLYIDGWDQEKAFVSHMIRYDVPPGSRVGVVSYDSDYYEEFGLSKYDIDTER
jgi:hypothetical protein